MHCNRDSIEGRSFHRYPDDFAGLKFGNQRAYLAPGPRFFQLAREGKIQLVEGHEFHDLVKKMLVQEIDCVVNPTVVINEALVTLEAQGIPERMRYKSRRAMTIKTETVHVGFSKKYEESHRNSPGSGSCSTRRRTNSQRPDPSGLRIPCHSLPPVRSIRNRMIVLFIVATTTTLGAFAMHRQWLLHQDLEQRFERTRGEVLDGLRQTPGRAHLGAERGEPAHAAGIHADPSGGHRGLRLLSRPGRGVRGGAPSIGPRPGRARLRRQRP